MADRGGDRVALWRRSIGWALVVINAAVLFKIAWTYFADAEGAGADAHLPAALIGLAVVDVVLVLAVGLARTVLGLSGRRPTAEERADFVTTVRAVLAHDTRVPLGGLRVPALVMGGVLDPFIPEAALRATADAIPDARLTVFPRNAHGVPKHRAGAMQDAVAAFLADASG